jgi:hypothetical protein
MTGRRLKQQAWHRLSTIARPGKGFDAAVRVMWTKEKVVKDEMIGSQKFLDSPPDDIKFLNRKVAPRNTRLIRYDDQTIPVFFQELKSFDYTGH